MLVTVSHVQVLNLAGKQILPCHLIETEALSVFLPRSWLDKIIDYRGAKKNQIKSFIINISEGIL